MRFPVIPCDLSGNQEGLRRSQAKALHDQRGRQSPGRRSIMLRALMNVRPGHLVDPALFDFAALAPGVTLERSAGESP